MIGNHGLMMGEEEKEINKILASMSMLPEMSMPPFRQQGMKQMSQQPQQQQQQKAMGINTFDAGANSFSDNRPKLKDFLSYMKPDSWANNSSSSSVVGPPKLDRTLFSSPATQSIQPAAPIQNPLAQIPQQQPVPLFQHQQQQQIPIPQQQQITQPQTQMFQPPMFQPVLQPQPAQQQPILQPQHFTQPKQQQQPVIQPTILQPQQAPLQPQVLHHSQPPAAPQFNQQQFPPQLNSYQPNVPQYQSPLDFSGFGMGGSNLPQPLMPQQISSDKPVVNSNLDSNRASASGPPKLDRTLFTASSTPNTLSLYLPSSNTSQIAPEQQQQQQQFALPSFYNQPQQQIYQQFQKN